MLWKIGRKPQHSLSQPVSLAALVSGSLREKTEIIQPVKCRQRKRVSEVSTRSEPLTLLTRVADSASTTQIASPNSRSEWL
jgi:hypothetical protein